MKKAPSLIGGRAPALATSLSLPPFTFTFVFTSTFNNTDPRPLLYQRSKDCASPPGLIAPRSITPPPWPAPLPSPSSLALSLWAY